MFLRSRKIVTAGKLVYAYQPYQTHIGYETGNWQTGCWYLKCPNGYAIAGSNFECKQGHSGSSTWASGYPVCPHGDMLVNPYSRYAHCNNDSGWDTVPEEQVHHH